MLDQYARISDAEIEKDIADTEREIVDERTKANTYRHFMEQDRAGTPDYKMDAFRATAHEQRVKEREDFVAFLRRVQSARADRLQPVKLDCNTNNQTEK